MHEISRERAGMTLLGGGAVAQTSHTTSNFMPALINLVMSRSPIATAVVTWPAVGGLSSKARQSADSASILAVSS